MENKIVRSDSEDGGDYHEVFIKRKSDGKYFGFYYSHWDLYYNFNQDFTDYAKEIFPKQVTITVFE